MFKSGDSSVTFEKVLKNIRDWTPMIISFNTRTVTAKIDDEFFNHEVLESGKNDQNAIILNGAELMSDFADFKI